MSNGIKGCVFRASSRTITRIAYHKDKGRGVTGQLTLCNQLLHHVAVYIGETEITPRMAEGEFFVIEAEQVQ